MNVFNQIRNVIKKIVLDITSQDNITLQESDFINVSVDSPTNDDFGDMACNAAMVLAKKINIEPKIFAEKICSQLLKLDYIEKAQVAGPGFINIKLNKVIWFENLFIILKNGKDYGSLDIGKNQKINIEYVSANPTGPMHIGHARGAVFGDALASLMSKVGYDVTREYYVNDAGNQIETLVKSCFLRYKQALGEKILQIPEGLYPGEYLKIVGTALKEQYGNTLLSKNEEARFKIIRDYAIEEMLKMIKNDLLELGIKHDVFTSEFEIQNRKLVEKSLDILEEQNLIYIGTTEPPKGKKSEDWEEREQTLFKSVEFGDDVDRPLKKSDGSWTYFASDCAYHLDKINRGFKQMVIVLGADHGGYVKRLKAIVLALSKKQAQIDIKICQLVNFMEDGQAVKMSKRAGTFTTVKDVIDEVGKDVVRFIMLTRKNDVTLDFDLNLVKEQSKDNPIFYVQYAHARAKSVIRIAKSQMPDALELAKQADIKLLAFLDSTDEIMLIKKMCYWPKLLESAAIAKEPHRIAFYLQDLAANFHSLWNKGKENEIMRFLIKDNLEVSAARIVLLMGFTNVIYSALSIFNIEPVEEMR